MNVDWNQIQESVRLNAGMVGPRDAILREVKLIGTTDTGLGTVARLSLKSKLSAAMLERLLLPDIKKAFEAQTGKPALFELEVESKQECFPIEQLSPGLFNGLPENFAQGSTNLRFKERLSLDVAMSFGSFIETSENRFAVSSVREFSAFSPLGFSVLTLHGPSGVGKSHLLHAAGLHAKSTSPNARVKIVTGDEFITDFQAAIVKKNMGDFKRRYRHETEILLVDDLHSLCRAKATQEEFFNLMNHIASTERRLIITSDRPICSLEGLEDRIKSRLNGGLVVPMDRPSEDSRREILLRKLEDRGIRVDASTIEEIARRAGSCIRSIEGVVNTLGMLARTGHLNNESLSQIVSCMKAPEVKQSCMEIMAQVAGEHKLSLDELRGKNRAKVHVEARRISMRRLKLELGLSVSEIGRLHLRDHSTVLNALKA